MQKRKNRRYKKARKKNVKKQVHDGKGKRTIKRVQGNKRITKRRIKHKNETKKA